MRTWCAWLCLLSLWVAPAAQAAESALLKSTVADQTGVEVTVYNANMGLVKDVRQVRLPSGEGELRFMDVAAHIMPVTVHAKSLNRPDDFTVLEQNYEYDLINYAKLLDKYVGRKIKLIEWRQYQDRKDVVEATLLSNNQGPVYQIGSEIYLGHAGVQVLPELPENLIAQPTLTWMFSNRGKEPHTLEVSYLTNNINWQADYVLLLNQEDTAADLSGWVTVNNQSGATYRDAKLKLIAGEIHRAEPKLQGLRAHDEMEYMVKAQAAFQEQAFFEYHIYDLQRPTTIKDQQTKQISLLEAEGVGVQRELLVHGIQNHYTYRHEEQIPKQPVKVYVKFKNAQENRLGMPLPEGIVRVYKKDPQGQIQFLGEDRVEHTPKDEEVRLQIGEAFDVVAERRQTDYRQITTELHESEWEIILRNHKQEEVTVGIVEPVYGNWSVVQNSHPYTKVDAFTLRFDVKVPKDGEVKVVYRIQVGL